MNLHPIKHDNPSALWCGPAAIAAVTGHPTSEIHRRIRLVCNKKLVMGMTATQMRQTLESFGIYGVIYRMHEGQRPTLARWSRQNRHLFAERPVIVMLTGHFVTLCGRRFVDNHTKEPVALAQAPKRRARVKSYMLIHATN